MKDRELRKLKLQLLPLKFTVLSSVSMMSTFLLLLLIAVSNFALLGHLDSSLNLLCLLLMRSEWTDEYWRLCSPLLSCVASRSGAIDEVSIHVIRIRDA